MDVTRWLLITISSLLVAIFLKWLLEFVIKCRRLPSGPWGIPLLGYIPWIGPKPHETFVRLAKKYGNVFSVTLGRETVVVLNDWDSIRTALVDQPKEFSGRPFWFMFKVLSDRKDLGFNDNQIWKSQRNLTIQILRNVGMGKKSMEDKVMDMVQEVMDKLSEVDGQILPMASLFFNPILKINWRLITGEEGKNSAVTLQEFEPLVHVMVKHFENPQTQVFNTFPWLRFLSPGGFGVRKFIRDNENVLSALKKIVDQHVAAHTEGNDEDFIDHYISEIKKQTRENNQPKPPYTTEALLYSIWSLFLAGADTTTNTALWGFLYLTYNPQVQKKAQAEIDHVIGGQRLPNLNDTSNLPYLNAIIMEIHRKVSLVSLSLPHRATETTKVLGHTIPKNTTVLQNIYAVHNDPKLWDEPELFKPERFIDENNRAKAPAYLMPFSIGPRLCLGQSLAEMELKLLFACTLQQFSLSFPPKMPLPSLEPIVSSGLTPHPFSLLIHKRNI